MHCSKPAWGWPRVLVLLLAACGPGGSGNAKNVKNPELGPVDRGEDLPDVPAKIETTSVEPMTGDTPAARSPLLDVMAAENARWMKTLGGAPDPAYYLSYQIVEQRVVSLDAEGGALVNDSDETDRILDVEIRVGSPQLDNTRALSDDPNGLNAPLPRRGVVPFEADGPAIANHLWLETDRRYREAVQALTYVRQDQRTLGKKAAVPDFTKAPAEVYIGAPVKLTYDKAAWVARLKRCSERAFRGVATRGSCGIVLTENTAWLVNSEGSQIQTSWTTAQLAVSVGVKADDGEGLSRLEQAFGRTAADLPDDAAVDKMIDTVTKDLDALHKAPLAEPYVGPAILEGRAAGVFFHEVFGHRIEGHRQKEETSGKTFSSYVGREIMPTWLSVYDDPTLTTINGVQVNGFYRFDDEGVRARRAELVQEGKLVGFLMGRNPIGVESASNGHGRKQPGLDPVARQGNLVVSAAKSVEYAELEKMLLEEVKKQKRPYGMVFTDISGGFTNTSAFAPQAFKVNPVMAYRLYPDGRRELVRGIDISGTPLVALQSIRAASREVETFNGVCGAESGWVPVSASAPSLLIERLEIEKAFIPPDRPPVLSSPSLRAGGVK
ncbi:MAG TPA: metallopeptidase TldD-related protein [Kofleriaceae bacterium]|jgi:predicted Zn-dependent protease|nr:metallopeptidase TldD-related protein [Kofleriaceae bacterium]